MRSTCLCFVTTTRIDQSVILKNRGGSGWGGFTPPRFTAASTDGCPRNQPLHDSRTIGARYLLRFNSGLLPLPI
jgi:hypothetical protein